MTLYEGNMKEYGENMKEYVENMKKYVGEMTIRKRTWKNFQFWT